MTLFRTLLSSILLVSFVACVKADRNQRAESEDNLSAFSLDQSLIPFNNRAHFEAGTVVLEDIKFGQSKESAEWNMFDGVQLWFAMCGIRDRASQGTIRNEKFHITSELGEQLVAGDHDNNSYDSNPVTVNGGNCLRWSQTIPQFDFLAPSMNIALHFEIESLSGNLGKIIRRVGFNPWDMHRNENKSRGFFDLTDYDRPQWHSGDWIIGESVVKALKGDLYSGNGEIRFQSLTVEPVEREQQRVAAYNKQLDALDEEERERRIEIDHKLLAEGAGLQININMFGKPFVWLKDSTGHEEKLDINRGRFKIYMNLVASGYADNSAKTLLSSNVAKITGQNSTFVWNMNPDGMLSASVPMILKQRTDFGRVELLVKIKPISKGLRKLKPYTAVLDLGQHDTWVKKQTASYKFDENFEPMDQVDYDKYVKAVDGYQEAAETLRDQDRFYFSPLKMRFVRIMPGESATDRTMQYSVTTCVEHGFYGNRMGRGLQFDIVTDDEGREHKMRRQTNEDGCLTWFGFLSHKYYRKEVLEKKVATVKYVGTKRDSDQSVDEKLVNGYEHQFPYYMNPWDEKWTFGWDTPDMPKDYAESIAEQRKTAPKSQLFIADFRYETMGFRYAIDKYLDLKVKKAVLFKAFPYVLKYNSIVRGRNGTEKLRDGVYLMKIALQKDYLDPAAKGVRIYDKSMDVSLSDADDEQVAELIDQEKPLYENYPFPKPQGVMAGGAPVNAGWESDEEDPCEGMNRASLEFFECRKDELKGSKKQYISYQVKLVRVLGGMIITPVEFEVDDLRLMRIRNQIFIQLETIDESKLRLATILDRAITNMFPDDIGCPENEKCPNRYIGLKYEEIFSVIEELESLEVEHERITKITNAAEKARQFDDSEEELRKLGLSIKETRAKLHSLLGLNQFEKGSDAYTTRLKDIEEKLARLDQYRELSQGESGLSYVARFRNDKHVLINRVLHHFGRKNQERLQEVAEVIADDTENENTPVDDDPFLKFFFADPKKQLPSPNDKESAESILAFYNNQPEVREDARLSLAFESLKAADFSESPLTPSFDLDLLSNEGEHDPSLAVDDEKSGLPMRTFVGPLTFVFNTNGSSLRPTDILNEEYCTTAFCEAPTMIRQGVTPEKVDIAAALNENGEIPLTARPVYATGDSVNSNYENNKYYGYIKEYHGMSVDRLIEMKRQIEVRKEKRMQEGSQIINFTKTLGLDYVLLNDRPESRLKSIDHNCVRKAKLGDLDSCFSDLTSGEGVLQVEDFWSLLNERRVDLRIRDQVPGAMESRNLVNSYNAVPGKVTEGELNSIMELGWQHKDIVETTSRKWLHRMCFALTQKLLKEEVYRQGEDKRILGDVDFKKVFYRQERVATIMGGIEELCHRYLGNVYGYEDGFFEAKHEPKLVEGRTVDVSFSPVILERKVRAYNTTDRYVYRGGKSLNLNLAAGFNISSSGGLKVSTSASVGYKPWEGVKSGVSTFQTLKKAAGKIPLVGPLVDFIAGGFNISRSNARDNAVGHTESTTVSSGTFLVSQQATFDIELGEYERCLVARLHPAFLKAAFQLIDQENEDHDLPPFDDENEIASKGFMICTGQKLNNCLPVKEKYYYFTQHFTEGDMLDTADLHNHPWLLQLRGFRDFQIFTSMVGAREVKHIDNNEWLKDVASRAKTDALALGKGFDGLTEENKQPELRVIDRSDINWPLEELSRTYFEVLPTFPGLYTFMDERGEVVKEWPYEDTDPSRSFKQCAP